MCINSDGVSEYVYVTVNEIPVKEITSESKKYSGTVGNIVTIGKCQTFRFNSNY